MRCKLFTCLLLLCIIAFIFFEAFTTFSKNQENQSPVVTIVAPANNSKFQWNSILQYTISVDDAEDGKSEYDEIAASEVILKVTYLPDASGVKKYLQEQAKQHADPPGLALMKISTCFNCHHSRDKLIGPSFDLIAKRYEVTATNIDLLTQKVIKGSSGVWGNTAMPANPEMNMDMAKKMVTWILENNRDQNSYILNGATGALKTREKPKDGGANGVYVLTASYEDHGINDDPASRKLGQHSVILIQ